MAEPKRRLLLRCNTKPPPLRWGFYSAAAAAAHGSWLYATPGGSQVEVTVVSDDDTISDWYHWADAVPVGQVLGEPISMRCGRIQLIWSGPGARLYDVATRCTSIILHNA